MRKRSKPARWYPLPNNRYDSRPRGCFTGLNRLRKRIEGIAAADEATHVPWLLGLLLNLFSQIYALATNLRAFFYVAGLFKPRKLPCTVISIGNITAGGTGKTPMTIYLAQLLQRLGYLPVIVSRGYGGSKEKTGGVLSDRHRIHMDVQAAGDEPYMMALKLHGIPVLVGKNRFRLGKLAIQKFDAQIVILDDAFQHIALERDLNILLLDATRPFGNGYLLPRGLLREPLRQARRADAFLFTRSESGSPAPGPCPTDRLKGERVVFQCRRVPELVTRIPAHRLLEKDLGCAGDQAGPSILKKQKVFAFSGIANNQGFRHMLESLGCRLTGFLAFSDHYPYTEQDLARIGHSARHAGADVLVTTEKDYVRLAGNARFPIDLLVLGIKISFGHQEASFVAFVKDRILGTAPVGDTEACSKPPDRCHDKN